MISINASLLIKNFSFFLYFVTFFKIIVVIVENVINDVVVDINVFHFWVHVDWLTRFSLYKVPHYVVYFDCEFIVEYFVFSFFFEKQLVRNIVVLFENYFDYVNNQYWCLFAILHEFF